MRVCCTSVCLNLQFGHLRWTLMPCQMDKIRANLCEERPAAPEQLLDWDINNRLKWRGTGRRGNGPKTIGRQERVQEWNLGLVGGRRSCEGGLVLMTLLPDLFANNSRPAGKIQLNKCYFCPSGVAKAKSPSASHFSLPLLQFFAPGCSKSHKLLNVIPEWSVFSWNKTRLSHFGALLERRSRVVIIMDFFQLQGGFLSPSNLNFVINPDVDKLRM